jgi:PAS domain S-box-containing protein
MRGLTAAACGQRLLAMTSTIDLAARLSVIVAAQQEFLAAVGDSAALRDVIVRRTAEVTGGDGAVIEEVDGDDMVYRAASGPAAEHVGLRLPAKNSLSGHAVRERSVVRCDDVEKDPRVDAAACRRIGIRAMILAPLIRNGEAFGALKTYSSTAATFDDLDAYSVQLLAGMASSALMLATELRERRASEERYRLLFERNVAGMFRTTRDGRILDCNDAFAGCLGYDSRQEVLGLQSWDLYFARADREALLEKLQREPAMTNVHLHLKRKDGTALEGVVNISVLAGDEAQLLGTLVKAG